MIPKVALVQVRRTLSPTVGCLTLDVKDGVSGWSVGEKSQCQHRSEAKKKCEKEKDALKRQVQERLHALSNTKCKVC